MCGHPSCSPTCVDHEEGLVVALLALELTDVVVERIEADDLTADDYRRAEHLHVDERAVLAGPLGDAVDESALHPLAV
jgi:hypothetical protein